MTTDIAPALDEQRVEEFAFGLLRRYSEGIVTFLIDLASRTGLFDAAAQGPATSVQLAQRAGLHERYVREWAAGMVTAGILDYDAHERTFRLPAEHAACLTGGGASDLAPVSRIVALLGAHVPAVAEAFRHGGGVPYSTFRPAFTDVMDALSRGMFDEVLVDTILPLADGLPQRLADGARVADIGCGSGHSTNLLARAHPRSTFVGYDLAEDALALGRAEARDWGLDNVTFEPRDVGALPPGFDAVVAFDVIHDQRDPAGVLRSVHDALVPGGWFLMKDVRASSNLEDNVGNPFAAFLYGISTLHCMTVSLAEGGAGLGTVWGEQLACRMLADAGFLDIVVHEAPGDPMDSVYVSRRASA